MQLSPTQKKQYRTIGHKLNPVVIVAERGLTESVALELDRALGDHELIKVKLAFGDPKTRKQFAEELCEKHQAQLVQCIGKMILIYRAAKNPNPKLSNLIRHKHELVG